MSKALKGITIVDLTGFAMGPFASRILADMGADVIKVEDPVGGERGRGVKSVKHIPMGSYNWLFEMLNRNKRSLGLNWKKEEGKAVLHKLVEKADVFMTNMRPGILERSGLDYRTLSSINPGIIYAHCTGWGNEGPERDIKAFDLIAFARAGLMNAMTSSGLPPTKCLPGMGDTTAGLTLANGILTALFHRERTGEGQEVRANLLCSMLTVLGQGSLQGYLSTGREPVYDAREEPANALTNTYRTKDGRWLMLSMMTGDQRPWDQFCRVMGLEHLKDNNMFATHEKRCSNAFALREILDEAFGSHDLAEWKNRFKGQEFAWSPCQTIEEVVSDPQVVENDMILAYDHPVHGTIRMAGMPLNLSKTPPEIRTPAPEAGQHTEEILMEIGYNWDEISDLKDKQVII